MRTFASFKLTCVWACAGYSNKRGSGGPGGKSAYTPSRQRPPSGYSGGGSQGSWDSGSASKGRNPYR